ncbi:hypothetical protein ACFHW1_14780 [Micromonospora sp. LOL_014]|uniref:hypothetical protein n=1 Tax=Micromonospora sp. LOL_014 TaxID=3345415 RepID=UPI003A874F88
MSEDSGFFDVGAGQLGPGVDLLGAVLPPAGKQLGQAELPGPHRVSRVRQLGLLGLDLVEDPA